jgi:hypothetical protein
MKNTTGFKRNFREKRRPYTLAEINPGLEVTKYEGTLKLNTVKSSTELKWVILNI